MRQFTIIFGLLWLSCSLFGQQDAEIGLFGKGEVDSLYIQDHSDSFIGRVYLSRKFTEIELEDTLGNLLTYHPNSTLNLGVGATYKSVTLNLAYGFDFLNEQEGQGETTYLDLQTHIYTRQLVIDLFGQFYNGLYLENTRARFPDFPEPYYLRPDLKLQLIGFSGSYLFNSDRFSLRASLSQNERQLKSAGSVMLGLEGYAGRAVSDSTIVPSFEDSLAFASVDSVLEATFVRLGPSVGYGHTFVVFKRLFLTLSLSVNLALSRNSEDLGERRREWNSLSAGAFGRVVLGYNTEKWFAGLSYTDNRLSLLTEDESVTYTTGTGNFRLNLARRFQLGKKTRESLSKIPGMD